MSIPGVYLTVIMAMSSASVVFSVFVLNIHHRGARAKPAPEWLKKLALQGLARMVCLHEKDPDNEYHSIAEAPPAVCVSSPVKVNFSNLNLNSTYKPNGNRANNESDEVDLSISMNLEHRKSKKGLEHRKSDEEIVRHLRGLLTKQEQMDIEGKMITEWQNIAAVMDRFLFCLFFLIVSMATFILLVIKPMFKKFPQGVEEYTSTMSEDLA